MSRHTPLWQVHRQLGAWMDAFAGWDMPIRYTDIPQEHRAVRQTAGLFDVSHMGQLRIYGKGALTFTDALLTNQISDPSRRRATYSPMCHANGGTVDDLFVYAFSPEDVLLVVNAGNTDKDEAHIRSRLSAGLTLVNESSQWIQLAIQGPSAAAVLSEVPDFDHWHPSDMPFMGWQSGVLDGYEAILSRSGYTGGDGYELYIRSGANVETSVSWWQRLMDAGAPRGLVPVGLGARDTLRLEGGLPLFGHELTDAITPVEAALQRFVKPAKEAFVGRDVLISQMTQGTGRIRVGLELLERGIPREDCEVYATPDPDGAAIGRVSSGGVGIWVNKSVAMAFVPPALSVVNTPLWVEIRGRRVKAQVVKLPFYVKPQP